MSQMSSPLASRIRGTQKLFWPLFLVSNVISRISSMSTVRVRQRLRTETLPALTRTPVRAIRKQKSVIGNDDDCDNSDLAKHSNVRPGRRCEHGSDDDAHKPETDHNHPERQPVMGEGVSGTSPVYPSRCCSWLTALRGGRLRLRAGWLVAALRSTGSRGDSGAFGEAGSVRRHSQ